jgi:hypothetical protein
MAWNVPMTAVAGSVWTAAQWNTFVRDNLNETEASRALTASGYSVVTSLHRLSERVPASVVDLNEVTTDQTSYSDPETLAGAPTVPGPQLTMFTGSMAFVSIYGSGRTTGGTGGWISFDVSGATTIEASDSWAIQNHVTDPDSWRSGATFGVNLTEGLNTFTMKYRVSTSGTGHFNPRRLSVISF